MEKIELTPPYQWRNLHLGEGGSKQSAAYKEVVDSLNYLRSTKTEEWVTGTLHGLSNTHCGVGHLEKRFNVSLSRNVNAFVASWTGRSIPNANDNSYDPRENSYDPREAVLHIMEKALDAYEKALKAEIKKRRVEARAARKAKIDWFAKPVQDRFALLLEKAGITHATKELVEA